MKARLLAFLRRLMERRTHAMEVFIAAESFLAGCWLLWPGQNGFTESTWLVLIPDVALGGILAVHGIGGMMALYYGNVHMARRSALASAALWSFMLTAFIFSPPATLFLMPLVIGMAAGSLWVYVRLYLRYPPPGAS